jgi:cell division transport system permease protein
MFTRLGYFARETWVSLRRNKLMTAAGVLTVAVSLCILGGSLLLTRLVENGTQQWKDGVQFEIFFDTAATTTQVDAVRSQLKSDPDVRSSKFLTHEDAYNVFKRLFAGKSDMIATTRPEDLPESFRVAPTRAELTEEVAQRYRTQEGVEQVVTASEQVKTLLQTSRYVRYTFLAIFGALLFASLFLIVNTIRLATYARRREIEVMKLVGASNWFIRVPFMLEGLIQGALGAAVGATAVFGLRAWLTAVIPTDTDTWRGYFVSASDATQLAVIVLLIGAVIGVAGSLLGLRRFLDV